MSGRLAAATPAPGAEAASGPPPKYLAEMQRHIQQLQEETRNLKSELAAVRNVADPNISRVGELTA
eukprot:10454574-Alexandrium_andersonii.AAC.1